MHKHELFDCSIYECVLDGATKLLETIAGMELPGFTAWPEVEEGGFDENKDEQNIRVRYEESLDFGVLLDIEGNFIVPESTIKGIALARPKECSDFIDAFLPNYRADWIAVNLAYELHTYDPPADHVDERILSHSDLDEVLSGFRALPWVAVGVHAEAVSKQLFKLSLTFQNTRHTAPKPDEDAEWDLLDLPFPISWDEYLVATSGKDGLRVLTRRIYETFVIMQDDLKGRYSAELLEELDRLEFDELSKEDPFATGELVLDADGRVHFANDLFGRE